MSGYVTTTNGACTDSFTALGLKKFFGAYRVSIFSQGKYDISRYVLLMFGEILWLLSILLFSQTGQTGKTVPSICGTNTDYHSKYFCHILVYSIVQLISIITIRLELVAKVNCKTAISYFLLRAFFYFHVPLLSVCWVWSDLVWHNCVDSHPGLYHKYPEVEHPGSADSLHSKLQVSRVSGTEGTKLCWFERMTSKGTDRLPAMVHRSHRGCVQLQLCWRPGQFQKILSIESIIGDIATVVMVDLLDGVYNVFTHLHTMLPVPRLARLHELHPNWGRLLRDWVEGEEWNV